MKESARKLEMKCDIASDFHSRILEKYKYDYMDVDMDEEGNYKKDENDNYIYREKREGEWRYEEAMIAKEIVKFIEGALETYCSID
jgi:hypothetical protein